MFCQVPTELIAPSDLVAGRGKSPLTRPDAGHPKKLYY